MNLCRGHKLATFDELTRNGRVLVTLYNLDETEARVTIAASQRGALRMSDNWSRKRGDCSCLTPRTATI